jgi:hypothetical protein
LVRACTRDTRAIQEESDRRIHRGDDGGGRSAVDIINKRLPAAGCPRRVGLSSALLPSRQRVDKSAHDLATAVTERAPDITANPGNDRC